VSAALAVRGRSFSIVADVSFVVAAASLAIGTFFVASGGSGSSVASSSVPEVTPAPEAHRDSTKAVAPPAPPTPDDSARRESEARAAKEAEAKREQERKAREAAESKKREDDAKKAPRKEDDHDDLRNY
jgi:type IV secretory pathway VirB10-like protein